jgi:hypothetical protein
LDELDKNIPNFDNTDDCMSSPLSLSLISLSLCLSVCVYLHVCSRHVAVCTDREELDKVRRLKGATFKFDFNDYVIKILLATFIKSYFNLDQANSGCCVIV